MANFPTSQFSQLLTANKKPISSLNGALPLSTLRDEQQTANTGVIIDEQSEFRLHHQASGDFVRLQSQERGNYQPGFPFEVGIGVRLDVSTLSGDARAVWGYFQMDDNNPQTIQEAYLFGLDNNGVFVEVIKDSLSKEKTYVSNFNIRPNYTIDPTKGQIFQITYTYYGYGQILFQVIETNTEGTQRLRQNVYDLHSIRLEEETSVDRINLKVGALLSSTSGTSDYSLYIGGRQMSVIGDIRKRERINSGRVQGASINTTFSPILSLRKKAAYDQVSVFLNNIYVITDADAVVQIRLDATIDGGTSPNFGALNEQSASETAMELDTTADNIDTSTGIKLYESLVVSGQGNQTGFGNLDINDVSIPDESTLTIAMKTLSGTGSTTLVGSVIENW